MTHASFTSEAVLKPDVEKAGAEPAATADDVGQDFQRTWRLQGGVVMVLAEHFPRGLPCRRSSFA